MFLLIAFYISLSPLGKLEWLLRIRNLHKWEGLPLSFFLITQLGTLESGNCSWYVGRSQYYQKHPQLSLHTSSVLVMIPK